MNCRFCHNSLKEEFINLGVMAPANSYVLKKDIKKKHSEYPLKILVCEKCWLVQTEDFTNKEEFFSESYAYFSSTSQSWLNHAKEYSEKLIKLENIGKNSFVIEVASNDGYLLKNFIEKKIPCLGIEPTLSTAEKAEELGIVCEKIFLTKENATKILDKYEKADLIIGNNVYAHVPDINDFTSSLEILLKEKGIITLEFPHLLNLLKFNQFDTIYHEHFSYLSLSVVKKIFEKNNLKIFNVDKLSTHGGSIRVYGCKKNSERTISKNVENLLKEELQFNMESIEIYKNFKLEVENIKNKLNSTLREIKSNNKKIYAYGAAAKGNTLLNFCGVKSDTIEAVVDLAPSKQNKYMPTSLIPIYHPDYLKQNKIDYLLILPWNIKDEIIEQNNFLKKNGTKFIIPIPNVKII
tara:strand:+ start:939 stop:2162 length:1224 start_codon:yes stop_codon:yes gene_type:complete